MTVHLRGPWTVSMLAAVIVVVPTILLGQSTGRGGGTEEIEAAIRSIRNDIATIEAGSARGLRPGLEGVVTYELRLLDGTRQRTEAARARVIAVRRDDADVRVTASQAEIKPGFRVTFRLPIVAPPPTEPTAERPPLPPQEAPVAPPAPAPRLSEAPAPPDPCVGHVFVSTVPPGASIELDGQRVERPAPAVLQRLPCGRHHVVVALEWYEPVSREATVDRDGVAEVSITLEPRRSRVVVDSQPTGAAVWLEGERRGTTPLQLDEIVWGHWQLRLEKEGYLPAEETLRVVGPTDRTVALVPCRGRVAVSSTPAGARVDFGGGVATVTASTVDALSCGPRELVFTLPGHQDVRRSVVVTHGTTESVAAVLPPLRSTVRMAVTPADATVHFAGQAYDRAPLALDMAWGRHPLRIEKPGFRSIETVIVVDRSVVEHAFTLEAIPPPAPAIATLRIKTFGYEGVGGVQGAITLGILTSFYAIELDGRLVVDWRIRSTETTLDVPPGEHRLRVLMKTLLGQAPQRLYERRLALEPGSRSEVYVNFLSTYVTVNGEVEQFIESRRPR